MASDISSSSWGMRRARPLSSCANHWTFAKHRKESGGKGSPSSVLKFSNTSGAQILVENTLSGLENHKNIKHL